MGGCDQSGINMPGRMQGPHEDVGLSASTQGLSEQAGDAALVHTDRAAPACGLEPCAFSAGKRGGPERRDCRLRGRCGLGVLRDWLLPGEPGEIVALQAFLSCP